MNGDVQSGELPIPEQLPVEGAGGGLPNGARRMGRLWLTLGLIVLVFWKPLWDLARLAWKDEFHSHILLVPVIAGYLMMQRKGELPKTWRSSKAWAVGASLAGLLAWGVYAGLKQQGTVMARADALCLQMLGVMGFVYAAGFYWAGREVIHKLLFPSLFLLFMVPVPAFAEHAASVFLQHASAEASYWLIELSRTPVMRDGLLFKLPGIEIVVAEECSGIRSSFVLLITSMIAGSLYLRTAWARVTLVAIVLPLAIVRNAIRIFTIAMLTSHVDPTLIDSPIHHRGGPIFFVLSLIPFFAILWWLRNRELKSEKSSSI